VARGAGDVAARGALAQFLSLVPTLKLKNSKFCIEVDQVMNTIVVDLVTLNIFHKGYIGFFITEFELQGCQK
jgi:hypothetical protein